MVLSKHFWSVKLASFWSDVNSKANFTIQKIFIVGINITCFLEKVLKIT